MQLWGIMPQMGTNHYFLTVMFSSFFMGILSFAIGIVAAAVGWKKHSVTAAIVCSLIIVCALANCITISPSNIIWVMGAISAAFVIIADFVYHVLANGIEKMEV